MSATVEQIRAALVALIAAVPDIGVVNDYERYAERASDMQRLYVAAIDGEDQLRGWFVRRVATIEQDISATAGGRYVVTHTWRIQGYMALSDAKASEKTFDTLIEAVRAALRADISLGGLVSSIETPDQAGLALDESTPVLFAGVLCHSARLSLKTTHYQ